MKAHCLPWELNLVYQELLVYGVIKYSWNVNGFSHFDSLGWALPLQHTGFFLR